MSKIEWTGTTWNPIVGCSLASPGCANCYALPMARRQAGMGREQYKGLTERKGGKTVWTKTLARAPDHIMEAPLEISKPTVFFVSSMGDFFHKNASDEWRSEALTVMDKCPRHTFQLLTKRPELVAPYLKRAKRDLPPNAWLGTSVENRKAKKRIDSLAKVKATVRFLSVEPLLEDLGELSLDGIDWVIVGGESGPRARPIAVEWVRNIMEQTLDAKVPFFFKQWGTPKNNPLWSEAPDSSKAKEWLKLRDPDGKGGSLLDGRMWRDYPVVRGVN